MTPPSNPFDDVPTVSTGHRAAEALPGREFSLLVVEGVDAGRTFSIPSDQPQPSLVGKSHVCDVRLADPSVSRRHVLLEYRGNNLLIKDLGSTNGTFVDGVRVLEAFVHGGELIRIGSTAMQVNVLPNRQPLSIVSETSFGNMLGVSVAMRRLYPLCRKLAQADIPLVIEGETGTGKEVLAESLHQEGPRREGPFVVFDCTTVAPNLIESALFGHVRGAFTGAVRDSPGVFEQAHGGTILIDEIGDLPLPLQAKLLRAIERREVQRVGGNKRIEVDVRILTATRRDLDREVQEGRFRDDLFHRIAIARIELPPLRNRAGDVPFLAEHFARKMGAAPGSIPSRILARWKDYSWPGNVRELRNSVARWIALGDDIRLGSGGKLNPWQTRETGPATSVEPNTKQDYIERIVESGLPLSEARRLVNERFQERYVERILERYDGNVTRAAKAAGVARRHLQRLKAETKRR